MADTAEATLDMSMMLAFHAAFRRDLRRLADSVDSLDARPAVIAGWKSFKEQLGNHHRAEDDDLWPVVRAHIEGEPDALALLDAMEAEHSKIDPMIEQIDGALADPNTEEAALAQLVASFRDLLTAHLAHEENDALPLIQRVVTPAEWKHFSDVQREKAGMKGAAELFPWLMDGNTPESQALNARLPFPVKALNKLIWTPKYNRTTRW